MLPSIRLLHGQPTTRVSQTLLITTKSAKPQLLGTFVRILVMLAYRPAFWYYGDSGSYLILSERDFEVDPTKPLGYVFFLKVLRPTGTLFSVVMVQHAIGVAIALAVYIFLLRRGVKKWVACLASAPLLLDALLLTLEHYVLSELIFVGVLLAVLFVLIWPQHTTWYQASIAGLLLFVAWFVRPVAAPLVVIFAAYLLVRRAGWGPIGTYLAAFVVPYLGFMVLVIGNEPSAYGSYWSSRTLYGRVAPFADCAQLELTPAQRALCPNEPVGQRPKRGDWYIWNGPASAPESLIEPGVMSGFAWEAIRQQPVDYARTVAREAAQHFMPLPDRDEGYRCLRGRYTMPETARGDAQVYAHCHPELGKGDFGVWHADPQSNPESTGLTRLLHQYSTHVHTPTLAILAVFVMTVLALFRRPMSALSRDAAQCVACAAVLIVGPVLVSMYEIRYAAPALPFVCLAGALAWTHLSGRQVGKKVAANVERRLAIASETV